MPTTFSDAAPRSDALTFTGGALSAVGSGAYSYSSDLLDNTPGSANGCFINGLLRLTFSTPITAGSGTPYITLFPAAALDGASIAAPPGTTNGAPAPNARFLLRQLVATGAYSIVDFGDPLEGFPLASFKYGFQFLNGSGAAWSLGGTIAATLFRWNPQGA